MRAWVSRTQRRSITIFWPKIVMLSSLHLKRPKTVKKFSQTAFGVCLTVYNGSFCGLFWKKITRMLALGLTDLWFYFLFIFLSFITNYKTLGREMQTSIIKIDWLHWIESIIRTLGLTDPDVFFFSLIIGC